MPELALKPEGANSFISNKRNDALKLVAMLSMLIDHLGYMGIVTNPFWYIATRTVGRIAFPIFAYQIAIGYSKTSNLKSYIKRLFLFALISQLPYIMFNRDFTIHPFHFNVIFLLLFGLISIFCYEKAKEFWRTNKGISLLFIFLMLVIILFPQVSRSIVNYDLKPASGTPVFSTAYAEIFIKCDFAFSYGSYGIMMVLLFHLFKGKPIKIVLSYIILSLIGVWFNMANILYIYGERWFGHEYGFMEAFFDYEQFLWLYELSGSLKKLTGYWFQVRSLLAIPFIVILERFHINIKFNRLIGYWFYPMHLLLIGAIAFYINVIL